MIEGVKELCPHCQAFCGLRVLFGMSSGLGPTVYTCESCEKPLSTERREWGEMGRWSDPQDAGRLRYLVVSLVYVALLGALGGVFVGTAIRFIRLGPWAGEVPLTQFAAYWPYGLIVGAAVAGLQLARVGLSKRRARGADRPPPVASFLSPHTNLQFWVLIALILPVGICWLIGLALHR